MRILLLKKCFGLSPLTRPVLNFLLRLFVDGWLKKNFRLVYSVKVTPKTADFNSVYFLARCLLVE